MFVLLMMALSRKRYRREEVVEMLENGDFSSEDESNYSDDSGSDTELYDYSSASDTDDLDGVASDDDDDATAAASADSSADGWQLKPNYSKTPLLPFTVTNVGPQHPDTVDTELDYFKLFFTDSLVADIAAETNRYAKSKLENATLRPNSIWHTWKDVTAEELQAYLGVVLNMALNDKCDVKHYFSHDWLDYMPFFSSVFSRKRFLQLHWMLHVSQPSSDQTQNVNRRGAKIEHVVLHMKQKVLENFVPSRDVAIDESTVGFKGRICFRMYNPQKPTKWGLRVYVLADSATGYICCFEPYYGKCTTDSLARPDMPFTSRIVLHLCDELLHVAQGSGYHVFTDRFYTGFPLALELLKMNVYLTGTVMKNRQNLPTDVKKLKLKKHEVSSFVHSDDVLVLAWQDKRQVLMLSTYHDASTQTVQQRTKSGPQDIQKPTVIVNYTKKMGAVDRADHYCASYGFMRKSLKWWRKMFFWLLEVAVVNSYILFKHNDGNKTVRHLKYRQKLIRQLVGAQRHVSQRPGRRSSLDEEDRLSKKPHFIAQLPSNSAKDCAVCSDRKTRGMRRKTVYYCKTCSRKPGLHPGLCFEHYHTKAQYR